MKKYFYFWWGVVFGISLSVQAVYDVSKELVEEKDQFVQDLSEIYPDSGDRIGQLVRGINKVFHYRFMAFKDLWPQKEQALKILKKGKNSQVLKELLIEGGPLVLKDFISLFFLHEHGFKLTDFECDRLLKRTSSVFKQIPGEYVNYNVLNDLFEELSSIMAIIRALPSSLEQEKVIAFLEEKEKAYIIVLDFFREAKKYGDDPRWEKDEKVRKFIQDHIGMIKMMALKEDMRPGTIEILHFFVKNDIKLMPSDGDLFMAKIINHLEMGDQFSIKDKEFLTETLEKNVGFKG